MTRAWSIALLSREYPPFFGGGIGTAVHALGTALAQAGHRVVVITVSDDGREHHEEPGRGSVGPTVVRLPFLEGNDWSRPHGAIADAATMAVFRAFWPGSAWAMRVARELPRLAARYAIDVIEVPETGALAWFALARRRTEAAYGVPPIVTCLHSPTAWIQELNRDPIRTRAMRALAAMERDSVRWSDGLVCPSRELARWGEAWAGVDAGAVTHVPNTLGQLEHVAARAMEALAGASKDDKAAGDRGERVLFFGRIEYRKGIDTLLEAWGGVHRVRPRARLELVGADTPDPAGGGSLGAMLLCRLASDVRATIDVAGRCTPEEVERRLAGATVVVVPSPTDNLPCTMMEAMAHGRVVVAARAGGMGETIRDGVDGFLFAPNDADDLARAIGRGLAMPMESRRRMGVEAARRARELFGSEAVVPARLAAYERAIVRAHGRAAPAPEGGAIRVIGEASAETAGSLRAALAMNPDADFAHGWTAGSRGNVRAFITPTKESLDDAARHVGPVAIRERVLERADLADRRGQVGWPLARALVEAGCRGVVAPGALTATADVPEDSSEPSGDPIVRANLVSRVGRRLGASIASVLGSGKP